LLSVPYAMYAKDVQNNNDPDADPANEIQVLSKTGNLVSLSKGGGSFTDEVNDADFDPNNEIQTLSMAGSALSLSRNGGTVMIPGDNWGTQVVVPDATLTGNGTAVSTLGIAPMGAVLGNFLGWNGLRWAPLTEGQKLSLVGYNLSISGGNSVLLPQCPWVYNGSSIFYNAGNVGIGLNNPATWLHVRDPLGMIAPQVKIDNSGALAQGNASIGFGSISLRTDYSMGLDGNTGEFKLTRNPTLLPSTQNDGFTMIKTNKLGVTSFSNQSRSRVYHDAGFLLIFQMIPAQIWQPVEFNMVTYDTHSEWQTAPIGSNPVGGFLPRGTSFFTVKEEGYYQVNARSEFILSITDVQNKYIQNEGHVSIAIFVSLQGAPVTMYAQGNKLQGVHWMQMLQQNVELPDNLAPNVSDVVYLKPGDFIEIRVYQSILPLMPLKQGPSQTYVSVHKVS
jgi:hypothetical protein